MNKIKAKCEHCGKTRTYTVEYIDDYVKCKFCNKASNLIEVLKSNKYF